MLKLFKPIAFIALIIGGIYLASTQGWLDNTPLGQLQTTDTVTSLTDQAHILGERTQEVSQEVGVVLGSYVQKNETETQTEANQSSAQEPFHQRAFEYGRYLYCKQVVTDYELRHQN